MAPQFNLLKSRFTAQSVDWAFGSFFAQEGRTFVALTVRRGSWSHYELREVVGVYSAVSN